MKRVFLAIGSNLGDRAANLQRAVQELKSPRLRVVHASPVYETAPQGFAEQGWFLNAVLEAETELPALDVLARCLEIEDRLGRQREIPNGPRTIDVDVLLYGDDLIHGDDLQVPHPRYRDRRFVLQPLADLDPDLRDPETGQTTGEMLAALEGQEVRKTSVILLL